MVGKKLDELGYTDEIVPPFFAVKESVLPFVKFPGVDIILSPEMKSTGEVMGIDENFGIAFFKSQQASYSKIPLSGNVFISVRDSDKEKIVPIARRFHELGYKIVATKGTAERLERARIPAEVVKKVVEGRPNIMDQIRSKEIHLVINTPTGSGPMVDEAKIRSLAVSFGIPCITTLNAAKATIQGIEACGKHDFSVKTIQEYHKMIHRKLKRKVGVLK